MEYKVKVTDENGKETEFTVKRSSPNEENCLNDFILEALLISEDKRKLPFKIQAPNGTEVYPSIKMKFKNFGSPLLGDDLESMHVTWQ